MVENLTFIWNIIKTAFGIGFVVFVHELGHFLLAKWNGVKVEQFSIGFGRTLISYRHGVGFRVGTGSRPPAPGDPPGYGETEYILAVLPLGGYVRMLGQNLENQTEATDQTDDPRSFNRKPVFARMQIITAGVIMNLILGVFCYAFVYTQGWTDAAAQIGTVLPGASAYKAGLRAGDEIVAIDGRRDVGYSVLRQKVNYSGAGQKVLFTIRRPDVEGEQTLAIEPMRFPNDPAPTIGVLQSASLELVPNVPYEPLAGQAGVSKESTLAFDKKDKVQVIAVGPEGGPLEKVATSFAYHDFIRKLDKLKDRPVVVEVERTKLDADGNETTEKSLAKLTLPVHHYLEFGLKLTPGPIAAIRHDSPAERAGLQAGDRIVAIDEKADFDPMRLPEEIRAKAGIAVKLTISRPEEGKAAKTLEISVVPDDTPVWADPAVYGGRLTPLDLPGIGVALDIEPRIQAVAEGSPAAKAGLKPGQVLRSITLSPKKGADSESEPKPIELVLDGPTSGWPIAFNLIQQIPMKSIKLKVDSSNAKIEIVPEVDTTRHHVQRGLRFFNQLKKFPPQNFTEALRRGFDETLEGALNVIFIFRNITQGRVGLNAFSGPLPIAQTAFASASGGWVTLIHFLGFLSVNLAVINFLPIPPLDGGQFLFLAAEKIRGKPLPDSWLNNIMIAGVIFVFGLIILVNGKDIFVLISSYF